MLMQNKIVNKKELDFRLEKLNSLVSNNELILLLSANEIYRTGDTSFRFRQDNNFYYLTGINEPCHALILFKQNEKLTRMLFIPDRDLYKEQWDGPRLSIDEAINFYEIEQIYFKSNLSNILLELIPQSKKLYGNYNSAYNEFIREIKLNDIPTQHVNILLSTLRIHKSDFEITQMQIACDISAEAHNTVLRQTKFGMSELDVECIFRKACLDHGVIEMAYQPIVATGNNACVLHYKKNNAPLGYNDLLLIDAGGEFNLYASDITRTFPINKNFTPEQEVLYKIVLQAQKTGISMLKPGNSWEQIQQAVIHQIVAGMVDANLLRFSVEENILVEIYKEFYMHSAGHWLGLDTHDVGSYKNAQSSVFMQPGFVLTMEPGIYIAKDNTRFAPEWRGIGIRIEDNILVTKDEPLIMTAKAVKEIDEIIHMRS